MLVFSRRVDHDINIRTWNIQPNAQSQRRTQFMLSDAAACVQSTCGWSSVPITLLAGPVGLGPRSRSRHTIKRWWERSFISYNPKNVIEFYDMIALGFLCGSALDLLSGCRWVIRRHAKAHLCLRRLNQDLSSPQIVASRFKSILLALYYSY